MTDNPYDGMMEKMNPGDTFTQRIHKFGKIYSISVIVYKEGDKGD